jgi:hypothetical protein
MKNTSTGQALAKVAIATAILLLIPALAMKFGNDVNWSVSDFIVAGAMLFSAGLTYQLATRKSHNGIYRAAVALACGSALFLLWSNLAVGIIGSENNPANWMYVGVLAIGIAGGIVARFRAREMAITMFVMASATALCAVIALVLGLGGTENSALQIINVNGFFVALFAGAGVLFLLAARRTAEQRTA